MGVGLCFFGLLSSLWQLQVPVSTRLIVTHTAVLCGSNVMNH